MKKILGFALFVSLLLNIYGEEGNLKVLREGSDIFIRTNFNKRFDLTQSLTNGKNGQIDFRLIRLTNRRLPFNSSSVKAGNPVLVGVDESAPLKLNSTYIGGNHGATVAVELTITNHGFSEKNIGKILTLKDKKFYLIDIIDANKIQVISENSSSGPIWNFERFSIKNEIFDPEKNQMLKVEKAAIGQERFTLRIEKQQFLVDGAELPMNQVVIGKNFKIIESYSVIAPDTILTAIKQVPGQAKNAYLTGAESLFVIDAEYDFIPNGSCLIQQKIKFNRDVRVDAIIGVMSQSLVKNVGDKLEYLFPKTIDFSVDGDNFDFSFKQSLKNKIVKGFFWGNKEQNLLDDENPPERFIQLLTAKDAVQPYFGFSFGYSLLNGDTVPALRAKRVNNPMWLWTSFKIYPNVMDNKVGILKKDSIINISAYRIPFCPGEISSKADAAYFFWDNGVKLLYLEYTQNVEMDQLMLPPELNGKNISIVENINDVKVNEYTVKNNIFTVSVKNSPASLVVKIE